MSDPTSTAVGGGMLGWKLIGGLAGLGAIGAGLAAVVVMCITTPRDPREWTVGLISTVLGSVCGGAAVVQWWDLQHWAQSPFGLVSMLGLCFACGLPGWTIVRWLFNYMGTRKDNDIAQVINEIRKIGRGE